MSAYAVDATNKRAKEVAVKENIGLELDKPGRERNVGVLEKY